MFSTLNTGMLGVDSGVQYRDVKAAIDLGDLPKQDVDSHHICHIARHGHSMTAGRLNICRYFIYVLLYTRPSLQHRRIHAQWRGQSRDPLR